jgi:hypothetical protein
VNFGVGDDKSYIVGNCLYVGADFCQFPGSFDPKKLNCYKGKLNFKNNERNNIEFFQIFYEGVDIEDGSEKELILKMEVKRSQEQFIFGCKRGVIRVKADFKTIYWLKNWEIL